MDNFEKVVFIGGVIAAWYIFAQKKAIGLLNYYIKSVGLQFEGFTPVLNLNIGIQNPSNTGFTVSDFTGNLLADGENVGTMSSFTPMNIPAASEVTYPVTVRMNTIGIVSDIISLINQQSGNPQKIELKGFVNANGVVAPIDLNYTISF